MCDFEPLNRHVDALHHLVQAAQSMDEMSQTITDLLSEQRVKDRPTRVRPGSEPRSHPAVVCFGRVVLQESYSRSSHRSSAATPQSESAPGTTASTSSKTPPSLSLQGTSCQALHVPGPAPLEDLSPDSIDAQTFDFETIGHPNMDPVLQQGSLDLDSLAESPESDFMSAVNEFVIEETLTSPNPISDPTSPEMMVESLYSSVINAIDSKRMQDTTILERENARVAAFRRVVERYQSAAEESRAGVRSVKDDLCRLRTAVLKEQQDFGLVLRNVGTEVRSICHDHRLETTERHQKELLSLRRELEEQVRTLTEENRVNQNIVRDVQRAMLELEGLVERKEKELVQLENEKERLAEAERKQRDVIRSLEQATGRQEEEIEALSTSNGSLSARLKDLHAEIERSRKEIREELEVAEQTRLRELQEQLKQEHRAELESLSEEKHKALEDLAAESGAKLIETLDQHANELGEKERRLQDLERRGAELAELRCKLEVELALKEAETEELRGSFEEARTQQDQAVRSRVESETRDLREELARVQKQLRLKNEEYEVDLSELRTLMRIEKDHCISELVDRHDEEAAALRNEVASLREQAEEAARTHGEQQERLRQEAEQKVCAAAEEKGRQWRSFQDLEQELRTLISNLQAENELLSKKLDDHAGETDSSSDAFEELQQQKDEMERKLRENIGRLETELQQRRPSRRYKHATERRRMKRAALKPASTSLCPVPSDGGLPLHADAAAPLSLDSAIQERLQQERASLQSQMELLEKQKNEEIQNLKTSLIAEQQVGGFGRFDSIVSLTET